MCHGAVSLATRNASDSRITPFTRDNGLTLQLLNLCAVSNRKSNACDNTPNTYRKYVYINEYECSALYTSQKKGSSRVITICLGRGRRD